MKRILFSLLFLLAMGIAGAQNTVVSVQTSSSSESITLGERGVIYFDGNSIKICDQNNSTSSFDMDQVTKLTLSDELESIVSPTSKTLQIFPNPTTGKVFINNATSNEVSVYSLNGSCLLTRICNKGEALDLSTLAKGAYLIKCGDQVAKIYKH